MNIKREPHLEPVPGASQMAVLPFLASIDGYLRGDNQVSGLRITMHRVMSRLEIGYLQQVCAYVGTSGVDGIGKVGRTFSVDKGVMGSAFKTRAIWRTRCFSTQQDLRTALNADLRSVGDSSPADKIPLSYLAVPLLGPDDQVVLILYADCNEFNYFADNGRVKAIASMCTGFCRVFDELHRTPVDELRNFPLSTAPFHRDTPDVYDRIQEEFDGAAAPKFAKLQSFNFEAAA